MVFRSLLRCAGAVVVSLANCSAAAAAFSFVAIGDLPYRVPQQLAAFERLINRVNAIAPAFTVHVGDIKNGGSPCDDEVYARTLAAFNRFEQPLVYTPGDNEWTDCHRADNGGYDPLERLDKVRRTFFAQPRSLGRTTLSFERQSQDPRFPLFVENTRWEREGVVVAAVHIVGSNNNLQRDAAAMGEYVGRNAANLAWIAATFERAQRTGAKAVVLAFQADPNWSFDDREDQRSGYTDTVRVLKRHIADYGKPVLIVHGDRHRFVVDKPLYQNRRLVYNATRLMVFGDTEVHGVLVTVDPDNADPFSFRTITVPE